MFRVANPERDSHTRYGVIACFYPTGRIYHLCLVIFVSYVEIVIKMTSFSLCPANNAHSRLKLSIIMHMLNISIISER
jgi:hypothetical protein